MYLVLYIDIVLTPSHAHYVIYNEPYIMILTIQISVPRVTPAPCLLTLEEYCEFVLFTFCVGASSLVALEVVNTVSF